MRRRRAPTQQAPGAGAGAGDPMVMAWKVDKMEGSYDLVYLSERPMLFNNASHAAASLKALGYFAHERGVKHFINVILKKKKVIYSGRARRNGDQYTYVRRRINEWTFTYATEDHIKNIVPEQNVN